MFNVLVLRSFIIIVIFKIAFMFPFTINLKSPRPTVQFEFSFMVFGQCKTRVDILLSIFLWVAILNQDGYRLKARNILDNDGLASPGVIIRHQDV
ncbi:hypothetical protein Hanom_Chr04g00283341 [Helianthus anomalus]